MLISLSPSLVKIFLSLFQPRSVDFSPPSSSTPRVFVAHTRIPDSVLLAFAASTLDTSLHCYLPSVPVSFSLICLYPQPTVASHFLVAISFWLTLAFRLSISFRLPSIVHACNTLPSPFITVPPRWSHSLSLFGRCSLSIGVDIRRYVCKCIIINYTCRVISFSRFKSLEQFYAGQEDYEFNATGKIQFAKEILEETQFISFRMIKT